MTKQRKLVKDILCEAHAHLTAEEIFIKAKSVMPDIALGTIYRNLGLLTKSGDILKIDVPDEASRYDGNVIPHEHIACTVCGRVDDIEVEGIKELLTSYKGDKIDGYSLVLYHVCPDCRKRKQSL